MSDKFEQLLEEAGRLFRLMPVEKTPDCPSDKDLHLLCFEDSEEGPMTRRYLEHVVMCPFCVRVALDIIRSKLRYQGDLSEVERGYFPLPDEIDWVAVSFVELFKDNYAISKQEITQDKYEIQFEISDSGFYHLAIDTGQIIWRREISQIDMKLSNDEVQRALNYGEAASAGGEEKVIFSFSDKYWDDILAVSMVKRIGKPVLKVRIDLSGRE